MICFHQTEELSMIAQILNHLPFIASSRRPSPQRSRRRQLQLLLEALDEERDVRDDAEQQHIDEKYLWNEILTIADQTL
jgi:hypothetical protein